ncbi:MAG: EamA family transporter [Proteobacteria bacterium]|nr:EamA family transporter [Pseudomonadota bacterium]
MTFSPATIAGFLAIGLWALLAWLTTMTAGLPPFLVTAITFGIGGLAGLAVVAARGQLAALRQPLSAWALGVVGLFGYHAAYFAALKLAPPAEVSLVNYLWPLLIVLFSGFLPGERLLMRHVTGALLGFAGVAVLAVSKGGFSGGQWAGYALGLLAAFLWSAYSVLSRRMADVPTEAVAGFCLATALLAGAVHLAVEPRVLPSASAWVALVALGLGPVGAAFFLWDAGMKRGDIRLLGLASYATPVLSTLVLILAGQAEPSLALLLACALIVVGAVVARRG